MAYYYNANITTAQDTTRAKSGAITFSIIIGDKQESAQSRANQAILAAEYQNSSPHPKLETYIDSQLVGII